MRRKILGPLLMILMLLNPHKLHANWEDVFVVVGIGSVGVGVLGMIISGSVWAAQAQVPYCDSDSEFNHLTTIYTNYPCTRSVGCYSRSCTPLLYPSTCTSKTFFCQNSKGAQTGTLMKRGGSYDGAWISFAFFSAQTGVGALMVAFVACR